MKKLRIPVLAVTSFLLLGLSSAANAAFVNVADDPDKGRGSKESNGFIYNIDSLLVDWVEGRNDINVRIYTNYHNIGNNIYYGDLYIGTGENSNVLSNSSELNSALFKRDESGTDRAFDNTKGYNGSANDKSNWDYAFQLDDRSTNPTSTSTKNGAIVANTGAKDSAWESIPGPYNDALTAVEVKATAGTGSYGNGTWYQHQASGTGSDTRSFVNFTFDLRALGLTDPTQLAFRWAMTCANDVIRGVANIQSNSGAQVPEPAALTLLLAGLVGLGATRRRKLRHLIA
jgi:hypothetical protein